MTNLQAVHDLVMAATLKEEVNLSKLSDYWDSVKFYKKSSNGEYSWTAFSKDSPYIPHFPMKNISHTKSFKTEKGCKRNFLRMVKKTLFQSSSH